MHHELCCLRLTVLTSKTSAVSARGWIVTEVRLVFKRITVTISYRISFNTCVIVYSHCPCLQIIYFVFFE